MKTSFGSHRPSFGPGARSLRGLPVLVVLAAASAHCGPPFTTGDGTEPPDASPDGAAGTQPVTLVTGESLPRGIAVDNTSLYWVDAEDAAGGPGSVRTVLKDGTLPVTTLAENQTSPLDVAVDDSRVFWSVGTGGPPPTTTPHCLVMSIAKGTTTPTCVTSGPFTTSRIALNTSSVIVLAQGPMSPGMNPYLGFAAKTGGAPYMNVVAQGPSAAIVASDDDIFLGNGNGAHVDMFALPSLLVGPNVCIADCGTGTIVDLAIDTTLGHVMWATSAGNVVEGTVPPAATDVTSLATLAGTPQRIARDASYVYVAAQPGTIWAVPVASGGPPIALATGENEPFGIAVDGSRVYWTCGDGTIRAVAVPAP